jgi:hypothetical protein
LSDDRRGGRVDFRKRNGAFEAQPRRAVDQCQWLYAVLFTGPRHATSDLFVCLLPLGLAYGLVTFRPWAQTLGIVFSGLLCGVGVLSLILWLMLHPWAQHVPGNPKGTSGLIVDGPVAAPIIIALMIAFGAWQWWVLTRPQADHLFSSKPA